MEHLDEGRVIHPGGRFDLRLFRLRPLGLIVRLGRPGRLVALLRLLLRRAGGDVLGGCEFGGSVCAGRGLLSVTFLVEVDGRVQVRVCGAEAGRVVTR